MIVTCKSQRWKHTLRNICLMINDLLAIHNVPKHSKGLTDVLLTTVKGEIPTQTAIIHANRTQTDNSISASFFTSVYSVKSMLIQIL